MKKILIAIVITLASVSLAFSSTFSKVQESKTYASCDTDKKDKDDK